MAETFIFELDTVAPTEDLVYAVELLESADGLTGWAPVLYGGDIHVVLSTLTPVDGVYTATWANADSSKYHKLVPHTVAGITRTIVQVIPPRPASPDVFTLYAYTKTLGLGVVAGIKLKASCLSGESRAANSDVIVRDVSDTTDVNGYAAIPVAADVGVVDVSVGGITTTIDTTGRGSTAVDFASLL